MRFFETVLSGVDQHQFLREVMGKRHRLFKGANTLQQSFSVRDIDELLTTWNGHLDSFVLPSLNGTAIHLARSDSNRVNQKQQVESLYRRGATLKIDGFDSRHPNISSLCRDLEDYLGGSATARAFVTPPGRPGYNVHFDALDTFVMQLDGTKHWRVFSQLVAMPTATQAREVTDDEAGAPVAEYILDPGDVLYMPAGVPHSAFCTETHSTHVTIGFTPWRVNRIAEYVVSTLLAPTSETIRQHLLPMDVDEDAEAKLKVALLDIASALERLDPKHVFDSFQRAARATMTPIRDYGIGNASLQSQVSPASKFEFNSQSLHRLEIDQAKNIAFVRLGCSIPPRPDTLIDGPHLELPGFAGQDLSHIFSSTTPFKASDIGGVLDEESRLLLLSELASHGVVRVVSA